MIDTRLYNTIETLIIWWFYVILCKMVILCSSQSFSNLLRENET